MVTLSQTAANPSLEPVLSLPLPSLSLRLLVSPVSLSVCVTVHTWVLLSCPVSLSDLNSWGLLLCVYEPRRLRTSPCFCSMIYICAPGSWRVLFGSLRVWACPCGGTDFLREFVEVWVRGCASLYVLESPYPRMARGPE